MGTFAFLALGIYTFSLLYITVYGVSQFELLYNYLRGPRKKRQAEQKAEMAMAGQMAEPAMASIGASAGAAIAAYPGKSAVKNLDTDDEWEEFPFVTVQLPLYNEKFVVERLIDNIAQFDYPKDRFEIHILDDSTDDTQDIVRRKVEEYKAKGFLIEQIRRKERKGFKAGALKDGMAYANGEFMAIFDADFLPRPDFLKKTMPHFQNPEVGVVQTRWEHINGDYSIITRLQALQLNVHFTVEQVGRMNGNQFLQFNGTAGIWRRKAIEDAGGWEADTLTEDFDLSIRTQLKGYKIHFLENIGAPAELPAEMNSLRSQQFRWMKGGAETARKMLPTIWKSDMSLGKKLHSTLHMLASSIFFFVFLTGVSSVPLALSLNYLVLNYNFDKDFFAWFMVGILSVSAVYYVANVQSPARKESTTKATLKFLGLFPLFLALSMGMSLHNTIAVIEGWRGKKSPFVRTPKLNIQTGDKLTVNKYVKRELSWTTIFEGILALYFLAAVVWAAYWGETTFIVYHAILALGYGTIFYFTVKHLKLK